MADVLKKVPVREQDPKVRATNFDEVCLGYNKEEAMEEAARCINCKKAKCDENSREVFYFYICLPCGANLSGVDSFPEKNPAGENKCPGG